MQIRVIHEEDLFSITRLQLHPDLLRSLEDMGVIELHNECINWSDLRSVNRLLRLRSMLGVNLAGGAIILDLLDHIDSLERDIEKLKKR